MLNTASHINASWYTDTDGILEHSPTVWNLYQKGPAVQKIISFLQSSLICIYVFVYLFWSSSEDNIDARGKHHELVTSHMLLYHRLYVTGPWILCALTGDLLNPRPFSSQASTQSTEPHLPGSRSYLNRLFNSLCCMLLWQGKRGCCFVSTRWK